MDEFIAQRSRGWFLSRKGRITASECYVLLANHKEDVPLTQEEQEQFRAEHPRAKMPDTKKVEIPFSEGTFTYLNRKVAELFMPDGAYLEYIDMTQIKNRAVEWGTFWEDEARLKYAEMTGSEVIETGFNALKGYEKFCGGSPDGYVRYEEGIIEIKSPFHPEIHQDYLLFEKPNDLKEYNLQYYAQIQLNIMVMDCRFGDFVSFDPRTSPSKQLKVLRIPKDEEMCQDLLRRIELATAYYRGRIEKITNIEPIIK